MTAMFPLPVWVQGTTQPSTPVNDSFLRQEVLARGATSILSTPPVSPADGQVHILGASPTDAWSTFAQNDVVMWRSGTWYRFAPFLGWIKQVGTEIRRFDGSAWVAIASGGGGAVPIQEEGTTVVAAPTAINFVGAGVTASNVGGVATVAIPGAAGALTHFTEARNAAAPNTAIPVHSFTAAGSEAAIDAALCPKGNGAILARIADNAVSGGNKRGQNAVDFQMIRANPNQVASGAESFIGGGRNNRADGLNASVLCGTQNRASGEASAVVGGASHNASGFQSVCLGGSAGFSSGSNSVSISGGHSTGASSVAVGIGSNANSVVGAFVETTGSSPQRSRYTLHGTTNSATPLVLTTNATAPAATNQVFQGPEDNRSSVHRGMVVARQPGGGGGTKSWEFVVHMNRSSGTLSLVAPVTPTVIADSGVGWTIAVTADNTLKTLAVTVTGAAGVTINWACFIQGQEVAG